MPLKLGSTSIGSLYLGSTKIAEAWRGNVKVYGAAAPDPFNPLGLPPYTVRILLNDKTKTPNMGVSQTFVGEGSGMYITGNIWDITMQYPWEYLFNSYDPGAWEILGANATGISSFDGFCQMATNLLTCPIFDTRDGESFRNMFEQCSALDRVPRFPFLDAEYRNPDVSRMFYNCHRAQGALDLYDQLSHLDIESTKHVDTFYGCPSSDTQYIPQSWGGTAP